MAEEEGTRTVGLKDEVNLTAELIPPEGNPKVGRKIFTTLAEVLQDKADLGLPAKWSRHYELRKNQHWRGTTKKATLISPNLLSTHVQRTTNLLTDNNPTFNVAHVGADQDEDDIYDTLLRTAEFWWREQEQQDVLDTSVQNGEVNGCVIEKVIFNPELEYGLGEVEVIEVDPFHFGVYPVKCRKNQKAEANLHFYPMSIREVRRRWPKYADKMVADREYLQQLGDDRRELQAGKSDSTKGYLGTLAGVVKNFFSISGEMSTDSDEVLVVECWVKDYSTEKDEEGVSKPKYKGNIRCIVTCNAGNVVMEDRDNPSISPTLPTEQAQKTYLFDRFPFSWTPSVKDIASGWGMSDFEQLQGLQEEIDKTLSQFGLMKDKGAMLKIINPRSSGIANSEFHNYPGILNPTNASEAGGLGWLEPPPIDENLVKGLQIYKDFFFLVAGSFFLEQAHTPGRDVIAYKAIAALIEQASTMLRGKIRNYSKMIRERGRMYLSHVMNWYTEDRFISYEEDGEKVTERINGRKMVIPAKLTVVSGSTMPRSQVQEREEAVELYREKAIDNEELLKKLDWKDRKSVIMRMKAGPIGDIIDKMAAIGTPEAVLMTMQELAQVDRKEFEREIEKGEVPRFDDLLLAEAGEEPRDPVKEAELEEKNAEVDKTRAEIELLEAKTVSEYVEQQVKAEGVGFDEDRLKIMRAEAVASMEQAREDAKIKRAEIATKARTDATSRARGRGTPPFRDRGIKSDNKNP